MFEIIVFYFNLLILLHLKQFNYCKSSLHMHLRIMAQGIIVRNMNSSSVYKQFCARIWRGTSVLILLKKKDRNTKKKEKDCFYEKFVCKLQPRSNRLAGGVSLFLYFSVQIANPAPTNALDPSRRRKKTRFLVHDLPPHQIWRSTALLCSSATTLHRLWF